MSRKDIVFAILGAFFLTNALIAEVVGGKIIWIGPESWQLMGSRLSASVGVLMWPVVFVSTDLINEYFGRSGVKRLTLLAATMIAYAYIVLFFAQQTPTATGPDGKAFGVDGHSFNVVFGTSQSIIVGSLAAFLVSQLVDVAIFQLLRKRTGAAMLWLRSTGSTVISQIVDSIIVLYIGLAIPFGWTMKQFWATAIPNYLIKLVIAICMTPVIYLIHGWVERYIGHAEAHALAEAAAGNRVIVHAPPKE